MKLIDMVPECFRGPEMEELQRVIERAADRLAADIEETWAQFSVETATWGLAEVWEPMLGIPSDLSKSLDIRRSQVKAKLQGLSVTTPAIIKTIAERYTGGVATVEEHPAEYRFRVILDGLINVPKDLAALKKSVAEIKPAHLGQEYALHFLAGQLTDYGALAPRVGDHYYFTMEEASA